MTVTKATGYHFFIYFQVGKIYRYVWDGKGDVSGRGERMKSFDQKYTKEIF
jgi:hypothetical protein